MKYTKEQKKIFGENVWIRRQLLGMSTIELGKAYGCGRTAVNYWERGEVIPPSDRMKKLAKVLNCSAHDLIRPYRIPKLSFSDVKAVVEKKEEPVMSDEEMVKAAAKVFDVPYTNPIEQEPIDYIQDYTNIEQIEQEEPKEQPKDKGSISDRMNQIYNTLFSALDEMDKLKADIDKIEKVTAMLKEIQGL